MSLRSCRDVRADLSAYLNGDLDVDLDGNIDTGPSDVIRAHLEGCAACRAELELQRLAVGALHQLPELPPPAAILTGVRARLWPEPWYRRLLHVRQWQFGMPIGALATVLVVVGIALFQAGYPELPKTVTPGALTRSDAPPAREMAATPAPSLPSAPPASSAPAEAGAPPAPPAPRAPARRPTVVDRQLAAPARSDLRAKGTPDAAMKSYSAAAGKDLAAAGSSIVAGADKMESLRAAPAATAVRENRSEPPAPVEPAAPTVLAAGGAKVEQVQPAAPAAPVAASKEALREESRPVVNPEAALSRSVAAKPGPAATSTPSAEKKADPTRVEVVCLLYPDGSTLADLERLLRRAGARDLFSSVLEERAVRETYAPYRGQVSRLPEPSRGWTVTAVLAPGEIAGLLDALRNWKSLGLLRQPTAPAAPRDPAARVDLHITVLN